MISFVGQTDAGKSAIRQVKENMKHILITLTSSKNLFVASIRNDYGYFKKAASMRPRARIWRLGLGQSHWQNLS